MTHERRALDTDDRLPRIDKWLMSGFEGHFLPRYLRKHFHAVAANQHALSEVSFADEDALVVYANHASWWDPMTALFLRSRLFPNHRLYAPIDAAALARYRIFNRMGFYGIATDSHRGAAAFLRSSLRIAREPGVSIWLTPEGKFCDVRNTQQAFMPGLGHLAAKVEATENVGEARSHRVWFVPLAVEYVFWEERLPECLGWFGTPACADWGRMTIDKSSWDAILTARLRAAQQKLAVASMARETSKFEVLLSGRVGTWGLYDAMRRLWARLRGERILLQHGQKFTPK
jgi:1-acyl-sn-glycerol-3-phosphate acyltransferase